MHVPDQAWHAKYVTTFGHSRRYRLAQTDRTGCCLRLRRADHLQDIVPLEVDVGIFSLLVIVSTRIDNEAVVGVDISVECQHADLPSLSRPRSPGLINSMIPAAQTPRRVPPLPSPSSVPKLMLMLKLRSRRQSKVHQMRYTLLPSTAVRILHAE